MIFPQAKRTAEFLKELMPVCFFASHLERDSFRIREHDVPLQSNVLADANTSWTSPEMETDSSTREQERIAGIP